MSPIHRSFVCETKSTAILMAVAALAVFAAFQARLPVRLVVGDNADEHMAGFQTFVEYSEGHARRWAGTEAAVTFPDWGRTGPVWVSVVAYAWRDSSQVYTATVTVNGYPVGTIDRAGWRTWRFFIDNPGVLSTDDLVVGFHSSVGVPAEDGEPERGIGLGAIEIQPRAPTPSSLGGWIGMAAVPPIRRLVFVLLVVPALYLLSRLLGIRGTLAFGVGVLLALVLGVRAGLLPFESPPNLAFIGILALALVVAIAAFSPEDSESHLAAGGRPRPRSRWYGFLRAVRSVTRAVVARLSGKVSEQNWGGTRTRFLLSASAALGAISQRKWGLLALFYVSAFVALGIATLPQYGMTWDEGMGHFFYGERYFRYFTSLDSDYLDFTQSDLDIHQRPLNLFLSPYHDPSFAKEVLPLADTLSGATMELFAYRLSWLDPIDAFHLAKVLLSGILLWAFFLFVRSRLGTLSAFLGIILLSTFPRFWGDMHLNPLDIPETIFFALTIIAFSVWYEHPSRPRALVVGIMAGSALATKGNVLFLPIVLIIGALPWQLTPRPWESVVQHLRRYYDQYALMITSAGVVPFLVWPYVYADPSRMLEYFQYLFSQGGRQQAGWNLDPLIQMLTTMPEAMLALLPLGLYYAVRRRHSDETPTLRLAVVWAIIPVLRASLPGMVNFDGIRHFEEFLPAACLVAAYGGAGLIDWLVRSLPGRRWFWTMALLALIIGNIASIYLRYSPYEYTYYNTLVGGLSGAQRHYGFPEATDYWGGSYRNGIRWLNAEVEPNAGVYVGIAEWLVQIPAKIWLRPDLKLIPETSVKDWISSGHSLYVMYFTRTSFPPQISNDCSPSTVPIHEIVVDGLPILQIYRCVSIPDRVYRRPPQPRG